MESANEKLDNSPYFQHAAEIKQPHPMTEPSKIGEGKLPPESFPSPNLPTRLASTPSSSKTFDGIESPLPVFPVEESQCSSAERIRRQGGRTGDTRQSRHIQRKRRRPAPANSLFHPLFALRRKVKKKKKKKKKKGAGPSPGVRRNSLFPAFTVGCPTRRRCAFRRFPATILDERSEPS